MFVDKAKSAEESSKLVYNTTINSIDIVNSFKSEFSFEVSKLENIKNDIRQVIKNDNSNSKQITELEQSEGIKEFFKSVFV